MAQSTSQEPVSDSPASNTFGNSDSDDYGLKDSSLSENDITITSHSVLAPLLIGERISFETSMPTTSTLCDTEEQFSYPVMRSSPYFSDAEDAALTNPDRIRYKSYNSFHSNGTTPHASVKSHNFLSSLSNSVVMSMETDYHHGRKCSTLQTLMNAYKGNSGPGLLSLPLAFKYGGLWVSLSGFLLLALAAVHSMHILSRCAEYLEERHFVSTLIVVMQCGFCCIYLVFVATNVKEIIDQLWAGNPSTVVYELMVFLCLVPFLMIKSLKTLAAFSSMANIVFIAGLTICLQYILQDLPPASRLPAFSSFSSLPLFLANALFAFEGIGLIIPLRRKMKEPKAFGGFSGVLNLAMAFHVAICAAIGFYGYLRFGENIASIVTLNLPQGNNLYRSVNLMLAIVVYFSTAVQFYVPFNCVWPLVEQRLTSWKPSLAHNCWRLAVAESMTRVILIFTILLVALLVPHVDLLISLVGALMGSFLTLMIPGMIDLILLHFQGKLTIACVVKDVALIGFALCALVTGTYVSLKEIVKTY